MNSGCCKSSLAVGRYLESTSRQRSMRSLMAGGRWSGVGGAAFADAIW